MLYCVNENIIDGHYTPRSNKMYYIFIAYVIHYILIVYILA